MAISVRGSGDTSSMKKKNGVGTGNTQLENLTVTGITTVSEPVNNTDAVTKKYVDDALENVIYGDGEEPIEDAGFVQSVNGKTGQVILSTSDLTNDSGFITADEVPSGLPTVTTEDASKVLTVDSTGEWVASDLPSDVICLTDSCPLEKVKSALEAFKEGLSHTDGLLDKTIVFVDITYQQIGYLVDGSITNSSTMTGYLTFRTEPSYASDTIFVFEHKFQIDADSYTYSKDMQTYEYGLPSVSTTDEGKVLAVNSSGKWAKTEIPSELPAIDDNDIGKVLTVIQDEDANMSYELQTPAVTTVDTALSATSENPVQNKVINTALNSIELVATDDGDGNVVLSIGGIS